MYFIENKWHRLLASYPHIRCRKDPRDKDYDLHVHVPAAAHAAQVCVAPLIWPFHHIS